MNYMYSVNHYIVVHYEYHLNEYWTLNGPLLYHLKCYCGNCMYRDVASGCQLIYHSEWLL